MSKLRLKNIIKFNTFDFFYKVLLQKKRKWKPLIFVMKKQNRLTKYKKYKMFDQFKFKIKFFSNNHNTRKKLYRKMFLFYKKLNYFYAGNRKLKYLIKKLKQVLDFFECRLDYVIFKLKFCLTLKSACNFIKNGYILVNENLLKLKTYHIKSGDFIQVDINKDLFQYSIVKSNKWALIIQNLILNYKTREFYFLGKKNKKHIHFLPIHLNLLE